MNKPILCIDFDGVIHKYSRGWCDGVIYDDVTDGFFDWAYEAAKHFKLVIYSSRSKTPEGVEAMRVWFGIQWREWTTTQPDMSGMMLSGLFEFAHEKPPAFLTIDDRALLFRGNWDDMKPENLRTFEPWNAR